MSRVMVSRQQRIVEIYTENRRPMERNRDTFCVTNFDLHRFFTKQLLINSNAGSLASFAPIIGGRGAPAGAGRLGVGPFLK